MILLGRIRIIVLLVLTIAFLSFGQQRWDHTLYSIDAGISNRTVRDVVKDDAGFMWIATPAGIDRFNGYDFLPFNNLPETEPTRRLAGQNIHQLHLYQGHQLVLEFLGTKDSIEIFDTHTFGKVLINFLEEAEVRGRVQSLFVDEREGIYFLTYDRIAYRIYHLKDGKEFLLKATIAHTFDKACDETRSKSFIKTANNDFWVFDYCTQQFLIAHDNKTTTRKPLVALFPEIDFLAKTDLGLFYEDQAGHFWLAFEKIGGIYQWKKGGKGFQNLSEVSLSNFYNRVWEDEKGNLIFGEERDLYTIKAYLYSRTQNLQDLQMIIDVESKLFNFFGEDFEESFFIASHFGLYYFNANKQDRIKYFLHDPTIENDFGFVMRGFAERDAGKIYIIREQYSWYELDIEDWQIRDLVPQNESGVPFSFLSSGNNVIVDSFDKVWGVSYNKNYRGRLHRYHPDTGNWDTYRMERDSFYIRVIHIDQQERFWATFYDVVEKTGYLKQFDPKTGNFIDFKTRSDESNPLKGCRANMLTELSDGRLAIGTESGLVLVDIENQTSELLTTAGYDFSSNDIYCVVEDRKGNLWLATNGGGLNILNLSTNDVQVYQEKDGLPSNFMSGMLQLNDSIWLMSTISGIAKFNSHSKRFSYVYNKKNITNNEFNRLSYFKDQTGNIYFGGINGFIVFDNEYFEQVAASPEVQPTYFYKYNGNTGRETKLYHVNTDLPIVLAPNDLYFGFKYMLPEYRFPRENQYQTWLEGLEAKPRPFTTENSIRYDKLAAGNYTLHILGADASGNLSSQPLVIDLVVEQIFYKTWWFILLVTLTLLGMITMSVWWYICYIRQKEAQERLIQRKIMETELQALRSQLNPHFVFNSLGSIQYFIQNQETEIAQNYLADFARLMRLFLESSRNRYITLEEELELLTLYIRLEQMRFAQKFTLRIEISENIDPTDTFLPSILIQPFVENAIKHGLFHKKEAGTLLLKFEASNDFINCIIEDNGIGRARAMEIKKRSLKQHKSRGMEIINDRLEVIRETDQIDIVYAIIDLKNERGEASGTRVVLTMPIVD